VRPTPAWNGGAKPDLVCSFIRGLYSGLAGNWGGKPPTKFTGMEWIQNSVKADTDTYAKQATPLFKPVPGFAREWVRLAKEAGCRYMVFTTKHHEGFALHVSKFGDYNAGAILHRDLVKEIVEAAHAEGLRVGFYHSRIICMGRCVNC